MSSFEIPVPHLITAYSDPLHHIEAVILNQVPVIEDWFNKRWQETPAPLTSSVDLRHAGFKISPVDTNLFPAGFNNLNTELLPICIQSAQSVLSHSHPGCNQILILPENHTRNQFYLQSLCRLRDILIGAGFTVRIGSLDVNLKTINELALPGFEVLRIEPLVRTGSHIGLADFQPCLLLLNNDLSSGLPEVLAEISQAIQPPVGMGWHTRLKSTHFHHYSEVVSEFSKIIDINPWLISPLFKAVDGVNFMQQEGLENLASTVDTMLSDIRRQYEIYGIQEKPFVVVKADNGTYGMGIMMVYDANELLNLNRKQRTKMSASKGGQSVSRVIVQEGIRSVEAMADGAVAEPVVYMFGQSVIGGFYRVHQDRGPEENLNAPGMHFEPLGFVKSCHVPSADPAVTGPDNRFYIYGVIARLAALAAAREIAALGGLS